MMHMYSHRYLKQAKIWWVSEHFYKQTLLRLLIEGKLKDNCRSAETNLVSYFSEYQFNLKVSADLL